MIGTDVSLRRVMVVLAGLICGMASAALMTGSLPTIV